MLWTLVALLTAQFASCQVLTGEESGLTLMDGTGDFSLQITIDVPANEVTITMCTNDAMLWFGFGFGGTIMDGTYAIIMQADGSIQENILGFRNCLGVILSSSFSSVNTEVIGSTKCVTVTRNRTLDDRFTFPDTDTNIDIIFASGTTGDLSFHGVDRCNDTFISITGPSPNGGGDPEYKFLDGGNFIYNGPCQYILVSNQCDKQNEVQGTSFTILTRHGRSRSREKDISIINAVIININDYTITIGQDNVITYDADLLTRNQDISILRVMEKNKKNEDEERIVVRFKNHFNLKVNLENNGIIWLDADKNIHTCGILGNNNGIENDDLVLSDGTVLSEYTEENINMMCDSWQVPYDKEPLQCKFHPKDSYIKKFDCKNFEYERVSDICDNFVKHNLKRLSGSRVEKCFRNANETLVDATRIFDDCKTQVCHCEQTDLENCSPHLTMAQFQYACSQNGVHFSPVWKID